jgi:pimeloyl-ACP methyl ester carboxylesterase
VTTGDGVEIAYTVTGAGTPALVLVHGWMCDQTYWLNQVDDLAQDHMVVTVDLPGHGLSGTDRAEWTVAGFGDDVAAVVEHLGLGEVILIGHSMGGPVSLEAARLMPGRTRGVIGVDTFQNVESEWDPEQQKAMLEAMDADFVGFCTTFVTSMFPEGADLDLVTATSNDMCGGPAEIGSALMRNFADYDRAQAMQSAGVPIRAVNATLWPTAPEVNRKYADFDAVLMEDVGHFLMQETPEEFNHQLRAVIGELETG